MKRCPYCGATCRPTREHLIPDWHSQTVGREGWETFNARSPTRHLKGDMEIKDVCGSCNNGVLSQLDSYGKDLFLAFLQEPAYRGESTNFEYDQSLLMRWLLKLCFNSARVHNADTTILQEYAKYVLGLEQIPGDVAVFAHLISPTDYSMQPPTAARRVISSPDHVERPEWFRLTQFRSDIQNLSDVVQRQVYIDSYCFSLFVPDPARPEHSDESRTLQQKFLDYMPNAVLLEESGTVTLRAGEIHQLEVGVGTIANYPARFEGQVPSGSDDFSDGLKRMIDGDLERILIMVSRDEIEEMDVQPTIDRLHDLVLTRETAMAAMQRVALLVHGWDDEPQELWEVQQVRAWINRLFEECPHLLFLISPGTTTLEMIAACYCRSQDSPDGKLQFDPERMKKFFDSAFGGLNEVTQRYAISIEHNKKISEHLTAVFASFLPPDNRGTVDAMRKGD